MAILLNITDGLDAVFPLTGKIVTRTDKKIVVAMPELTTLAVGAATLRFECTSGRSTETALTIGTTSA